LMLRTGARAALTRWLPRPRLPPGQAWGWPIISPTGWGPSSAAVAVTRPAVLWVAGRSVEGPRACVWSGFFASGPRGCALRVASVCGSGTFGPASGRVRRLGSEGIVLVWALGRLGSGLRPWWDSGSSCPVHLGTGTGAAAAGYWRSSSRVLVQGTGAAAAGYWRSSGRVLAHGYWRSSSTGTGTGYWSRGLGSSFWAAYTWMPFAVGLPSQWAIRAWTVLLWVWLNSCIRLRAVFYFGSGMLLVSFAGENVAGTVHTGLGTVGIAEPLIGVRSRCGLRVFRYCACARLASLLLAFLCNSAPTSPCR